MEEFRPRLAAALDDEPSPAVVFLDGTGLGDGLPLVRPDSALVAAMLEGRLPDDAAIDGPVPISFAVPTWWDLAACSVLAGCPPGALPLVAAALNALTDPAFNLLGVQATTGAAAPLVIVEGDAVSRFGLNADASSLGPGHRSNATIGRAIRLCLQGVGRCAAGEGDMATHGQPGKYTWLVAENRPDNPWAEGRGPGRVTVVAGVGNVEVVLTPTTPDEVVGRLAEVIVGIAAPDNVVLLPPESAVFLHRHGHHESRFRQEVAALTGGEPRVVVTGGTGVKATVVPGWGGGSQPTSRMVG
ncbi:MAG: hypothetical protein ACFCVK_18840 [Acidimicrobiales bacterium]